MRSLQVDSVLGDRKPTVSDMGALRFTTRVINESMRLYPQPPVLIRRALEDDVVGGTLVLVPQHCRCIVKQTSATHKCRYHVDHVA